MYTREGVGSIDERESERRACIYTCVALRVKLDNPIHRTRWRFDIKTPIRDSARLFGHVRVCVYACAKDLEDGKGLIGASY